jgi:hypothetical protein
MSRFILQIVVIKVYICHFLINIFYKNKKSKLYFEDRVAVLDDMFYEYGGSIDFERKSRRQSYMDRRTFFQSFLE